MSDNLEPQADAELEADDDEEEEEEEDLDAVSDVDEEEEESALHDAAYSWNVEVLRAFLSDSVDINARDKYSNTPLLAACLPWLVDEHYSYNGARGERRRQGDDTSVARTVETVMLLLDHGADAAVANSMDRSTALHYLLTARNCNAMTQELLLLIPMLLAHGADINAKDKCGRTPLHVALVLDYSDDADASYTMGYVQVVKLLLDSGANPFLTNDDDQTPLQFLIETQECRVYNDEYAALVKMLLHRGDPNVRNKEGKTLLHLAVLNEHSVYTDYLPDMIQLLLQHQVDPNIQDTYGNTPLHSLWWDPHKEVDDIRVLLEHHHHINVRNMYGNTPLFELIDNSGNVDAIELFLAKGADASAVNKAGTSLLHLAAKKNLPMVVQLLLDRKANINVRDMYGYTPFAIAIALGHVKCAMLLSPRLNVHVRNIEGQTLLHMAILKDYTDEGALDLMRLLLLQHHVDPNEQDYDGNTPLHLMAQKETCPSMISVISLLLDSGHDDINVRNDLGNTPLYELIDHSGNVEVIELFLARGADASAENNEGTSLLHLATEKNLPIVVQLLLNHKADVNVKDYCGDTPLHLAAKNNLKVIVQLLLDHMAPVDVKDKSGDTPLEIAYSLRHVKCAILLLPRGDPNLKCKDGRTRLHMAIILSNIVKEKNFLTDMIQLLLRLHADPNIQDRDGNTPLHVLAKKWRPPMEIITLLLESGHEDINVRNALGNTPLYELIDHSGNVDAIKLLLARGSDASAVNNEGTSLLHLATKKNLPMVVQLLLDHKADVNVKDKCGNTPLLVAVYLENLVECATLLLSRGADLNLPNDKGETALQLICSHESLDSLYQLIRFNPLDICPHIQQRLPIYIEVPTFIRVSMPTIDFVTPSIDVSSSLFQVGVSSGKRTPRKHRARGSR